jgi:hypothetical protein
MAKDIFQGPTPAAKVQFLSDIDQHTWPLVILAELDDANKERIVQRVRWSAEHLEGASAREIKVQALTPCILLLALVAQQGPHRDTQATLYALAVLAYQSGHSRLQSVSWHSYTLNEGLRNDLM